MKASVLSVLMAKSWTEGVDYDDREEDSDSDSDYESDEEDDDSSDDEDSVPELNLRDDTASTSSSESEYDSDEEDEDDFDSMDEDEVRELLQDEVTGVRGVLRDDCSQDSVQAETVVEDDDEEEEMEPMDDRVPLPQDTGSQRPVRKRKAPELLQPTKIGRASCRER